MRSTMGTLTAMAAATIGTAALVAATASLQPGESIVAGSLGNAVLGQVAAGILGVLVICGEYGGRTIRATIAAVPRRFTVLTAKAVVAAAVVMGVSLAASLCAYGVGAVMLAGQGHPSGKPMPALVGIAVVHAAVAVLGVALGTAVRHAAGAITAVTAILLVPTVLGPLLGNAGRWINAASPMTAQQKIAHTSHAGLQPLDGLGAWPTLWLICAGVGSALAGSARLLRTRDV
ncbi:MAG TPA: ABC transporter permease subunit [Micromonosporaceae bacterium]|nr:ABC transporter permease subunit [Micromonosporaceae bacterium]